MDKAQDKPYIPLILEMLIKEKLIPDYLDDDNDKDLIALAHKYIDNDDNINLGLVAIALAFLYSINSHIIELDATKEEAHKLLDNREIFKFCCYVLKLHSTDCKCINKVGQKIFNQIKYKNISKLLT